LKLKHDDALSSLLSRLRSNVAIDEFKRLAAALHQDVIRTRAVLTELERIKLYAEAGPPLSTRSPQRVQVMCGMTRVVVQLYTFRLIL
jgi:hypothetical protein